MEGTSVTDSMDSADPGGVTVGSEHLSASCLAAAEASVETVSGGRGSGGTNGRGASTRILFGPRFLAAGAARNP